MRLGDGRRGSSVPTLVASCLLNLSGTSRWAGPVLFFGFWVSLTLSGSAPVMEVAAFTFFPLVLAAAWLGHVINSLDDLSHRELHVAALGSHMRVTLVRLGAGLAGSIGLGLVALVVTIPRSPDALQFLAAAGVLVAAALFGTAFVPPFSPPLSWEPASALTSALLLTAALALSPPLQWAIRQTNAAEPLGSLTLLGGAVPLMGLSLLVTQWRYRRRLVTD